MKTCLICKIEKDNSCFDKQRNQCKDCRKRLKKQWDKDYVAKNKDAIKIQRKAYYEENKEEIKKKGKEYYQNNKEERSEYKSQYYHDNKEIIIENQKQYYEENKQERLEYAKKYRDENDDKIVQYRIDNKENITKFNREYSKNRKKNDPAFKIRHIISGAILDALKRNKSSKNNISCLQSLPYTMQELKEHLESLFEPWMNWNNHGIYNPKTWRDDDKSTWTWQIDHIIAHATFKYISMYCEEFLQCWALSNLRPYSAKQNVIDGAIRIRHQKL